MNRIIALCAFLVINSNVFGATQNLRKWIPGLNAATKKIQEQQERDAQKQAADAKKKAAQDSLEAKKVTDLILKKRT